MLFNGNQRGGGRDLALHLLKDDNEQAQVHEVRGFASDDLLSAFKESYAVSRATKCKQHLYSLSINPPPNKDVGIEDFKNTIDRVEKRLGLSGQPRAIVFHDKKGRDGEVRRHAHAVWCRINVDEMKAVQLSYTKDKLMKLSREIFVERDWRMPDGMHDWKDRNPLNYSHAEHQQARRRNKYADDIKRVFQDAWAQSDSKPAFVAALRERGYELACGERGRFVAVDAHGEVYALARATNVRTKDLRGRLGEADQFSSVDQAVKRAQGLANHSIDVDRKAPENVARPKLTEAARRLRDDPVTILEEITGRESVFSQNDISRALKVHLIDPEGHRIALEAVMASKKLVDLRQDENDNLRAKRYSTKELVQIEHDLLVCAQNMGSRENSNVGAATISKAIQRKSNEMALKMGHGLSREQDQAVRHMTGSAQLSCVIGAAGAGKSTILDAAREGWERSGHTVHGAALAGKAAKGLEQSSGIPSRTLASLELSWQNGRKPIRLGDVLVVDEAGMIGSRQMSRLLERADQDGFKLVMVGDAEQLQPIEAGAPFRAIADRVQPARLDEIHRQGRDWQKSASQDFAAGRTQLGLAAYAKKDQIQFAAKHDQSIKALADDYISDGAAAKVPTSQLALAHRKADVRKINDAVRSARKSNDQLRNGRLYDTANGEREFAIGDRLLFTRNDRELGVQNGMLGTVFVAKGGRLKIVLDDRDSDGSQQIRTIHTRDYNDFDHGYATTIHKAQGATVDRSYVLASRSMDRHVAYVAMTRHRNEVRLYAANDEFRSQVALETGLSRKRQKVSSTDFETRTCDQSKAHAPPRAQRPLQDEQTKSKERKKRHPSVLQKLWKRVKGRDGQFEKPKVSFPSVFPTPPNLPHGPLAPEPMPQPSSRDLGEAFKLARKRGQNEGQQNGCRRANLDLLTKVEWKEMRRGSPKRPRDRGDQSLDR